MSKVYAVYGILHKTTRKIYIGSTCDIDNRVRQHRGRLRRGQHTPQFQKVYDTDPHFDSAFKVLILHDGISSKRKALKLEQKEMSKRANHLLNLSKTVNCAHDTSVIERKQETFRSEEFKKRKSRIHKRVWSRKSHRKKMRKIVSSDNYIAKQSSSHATMSDNTILGILNAAGTQNEIAKRFGVHQSTVSRIKRSKIHVRVMQGN